MVYELDFVGAYSCLLASGFPILIYFLQKLQLKKTNIYITIFFLILSTYLQSRLMFVSIILVFAYFYFNSKLIKAKLLICCILLLLLLLALKQNSVIGRFFIWKIIFSNISQTPFMGFGLNSFKYIYSEWQSNYFKSNTQWDIYHFVADSPSYAYNEFINYYIELGMGFIFITAIVIYINITIFNKSSIDFVKALILSNFVILLFSLFSYPLHIFWVLLLLLLNHIIIFFLSYKKIRIITCSISVLSMILMVASYIKYNAAKAKWNYSKTIPVSYQADKLFFLNFSLSELDQNQYFLFDYAVNLKKAGYADELYTFINKYSKGFNQYEKNLLLGEFFLEKNNYSVAILYFEKAHTIIPNRFLPPYNLMNIAINEKKYAKAIEYSKLITSMPIKVKSNLVTFIIEQAENLQTRSF